MHGAIEAQEYRDYVASIHGSGRHLLTVINDILDLAKIDAGEMKLREETVDLARAAKTAVRYVTPEADEGGVSVRVDWDETPPSLLGDWKLVMGTNDAPRELFNLRKDPGETRNVIAAHPKVAKGLERKLTAIVKNGRSTPGKRAANDTPLWNDLTWMNSSERDLLP